MSRYTCETCNANFLTWEKSHPPPTGSYSSEVAKAYRQELFAADTVECTHEKRLFVVALVMGDYDAKSHKIVKAFEKRSDAERFVHEAIVEISTFLACQSIVQSGIVQSGEGREEQEKVIKTLYRNMVGPVRLFPKRIAGVELWDFLYESYKFTITEVPLAF